MVPFAQLFRHVSDGVAYIEAHAPTTKCSPTTIFGNILSILQGALPSKVGPQCKLMGGIPTTWS